MYVTSARSAAARITRSSVVSARDRSIVTGLEDEPTTPLPLTPVAAVATIVTFVPRMLSSSIVIWVSVTSLSSPPPTM